MLRLLYIFPHVKKKPKAEVNSKDLQNLITGLLPFHSITTPTSCNKGEIQAEYKSYLRTKRPAKVML